MKRIWFPFLIALAITAPTFADEKPEKKDEGEKVTQAEAMMLLLALPTTAEAALDRIEAVLKESRQEDLKGRLNWFQDLRKELNDRRSKKARTTLGDTGKSPVLVREGTLLLEKIPTEIVFSPVFSNEYLKGSPWVTSVLLRDLVAFDTKSQEKAFKLQAEFLKAVGADKLKDKRAIALFAAYKDAEAWKKYVSEQSKAEYAIARDNVPADEQKANLKEFAAYWNKRSDHKIELLDVEIPKKDK